MTCRLFVLLILIYETKCHTVNFLPETSYPSCVGSNLTSSYVYGSYPAGEENQYSVTVNWPIQKRKNIIISFDSLARIELDRNIASLFLATEVSKPQEDSSFRITSIKDSSKNLKFKVIGPITGKIPYFKSVVADGIELCTNPVVGILDNMVKDGKMAKHLKSSLPDSCGRRKNENNKGSTVTGNSVKPGDWPWHAAIYRTQETSKYICGATLISSYFVLTASQCVTLNDIPVVPDILSVALGKDYFTGGDTSSQRRRVLSVIFHENFANPQRLDNDIALLRLMTKAIFTDFVQPACIWSSNENDEVLSTNTVGTVVGWEVINVANNTVSTELKQIELPMVSKTTCKEADLHLYGELLKNDKKFCAGYGNGSIPYNEDPGSGFLVFVPSASSYDSSRTGSWHVRGIVSMKIPYQDAQPNSNQYAVFTDVSKYGDWIRANTIVNGMCSS